MNFTDDDDDDNHEATSKMVWAQGKTRKPS